MPIEIRARICAAEAKNCGFMNCWIASLPLAMNGDRTSHIPCRRGWGKSTLLRPFQKQRVYAAGAITHVHDARARLAAGAHLRDGNSAPHQARAGSINIGDAPAQSPQPVALRLRVRTRTLYQFDDQVAAAEKHQPAPVRMRAVERHIEAKPRTVKRRGAFGIIGRDDDVIEPQNWRRRDRRRTWPLLCQLEEEQAHAARLSGGRSRALPAQNRSRSQIAALDLHNLFRLQGKPFEPAMSFGNILDTEADAGKALSGLRDKLAKMIGRRRTAHGRHHLERGVVEREQYGFRPLAFVSPGRATPEQNLASLRARLDIFDQHDDMIETPDHRQARKKPTNKTVKRVIAAPSSFSEPAAVTTKQAAPVVSSIEAAVFANNFSE